MKITKLGVPFAQVPNELLCDPAITFKAKGLWSYIQSKPEDYEFSSERIVEETKDGVDAIKSALVELEEIGYLIRKREQSGKVDYFLQFPKVENPSGGKSPQGKIHCISNKDNTQLSKDNSIITSTVENPSETEVAVVEEPKTPEVPEKVKVDSGEFFKAMKEDKAKFLEVVSFFSAKYEIAPAIIAEELIAFREYWTEMTHSGKKQRWQTEKTFEAKLRLAKWFRNKKEWNKGRTVTPSKYQVQDDL